MHTCQETCTPTCASTVRAHTGATLPCDVTDSTEDMRMTVQAVADVYAALLACRHAPAKPMGGFLGDHASAVTLLEAPQATVVLLGWAAFGAPENVSAALLAAMMQRAAGVWTSSGCGWCNHL